MYKTNELRKDLEGFLAELDGYGGLSPGLSKENLIKKHTQRIEEFFKSYDDKFYNPQRINEVKNNLVEGLYDYAKVNAEYNDELGRIMLAYKSVKYGFGFLVGSLGTILTQSPFFGIFLFAVGSSWVGKKGVPITKEYAGLKKQRDNLIENFLK